MFSTVLGLFSQDLAVDPGTEHTRVWQRGQGIVARMPSLLALHTDVRGRRAVLATGASVEPMVGRAPQDIEIVSPIREGCVADYDVAEAFLLHLFREVHGRNRWMRPRVVLPVADAAAPVERRALRDACESAGARGVVQVPRTVAAAVGAGLEVRDHHGQLLVDLGAGSLEIAVLSRGRPVVSTTLTGGGMAMDQAIADYVESSRRVRIAPAQARAIKLALGSATDAEAKATRVMGQCTRRAIPTATEIRADEVGRTIAPFLDRLVEALTHTVSSLPSGLQQDIEARGIVLTGGAARLPQLATWLSRRTGLHAMLATAPEDAVVRGAGRILEDPRLQRQVAL